MTTGRAAAVLVGVIAWVLAVALTGCTASESRVPVSTTRPSVSRAELLQRQERLGVVARQIQDLVDPLEGPVAKRLPSGENRYGEVRIDSERDVVELWWAGALPPEAQAVLREPPAVRVEVHRARCSNNELQAAGRTVIRKVASGILEPDVTVDAVEHDVPAGRIAVHVVDPAARWAIAELHRRLDPLTSVPLDIVDQRGPTLKNL